MHNEFFPIKEKIDELTVKYSPENLREAEKHFDQEGIFDYFIKKISKSLNTDWLIPLKDKGFFDPSKNPPRQELPDKKGFAIPYWSVLGYLEIVSRENSKSPKEHITKALLEIVNKIIAKRVDNYRTDWVMLTVMSTLPTELITKDHIEFIHNSLNSRGDSTLVASDLGKLLIPKLINDKVSSLLLDLIDIMLDNKKHDEEIGREYISIMDQYWLAEALKNHKPAIAKLCGIEAANIAIAKMKKILSEDDSHFNDIWIPTIEDHAQISFPERYECQIVQFVRDMYEFYPEVEILGEKVKSLLSEEHPIFKRIAFHLINKHYATLKDLFWASKDNPLDVLAIHEIYELIEGHCKKFSDTEIDKLLDWIETKKYPVPEDVEKDNEKLNKFLAYRKKEWLSALEELKNINKKISDKFEYYNKIFPYEIDHPGFPSWSESGAVGYESPISSTELCSKTNQEIAEDLKNFKDEGKFVWGELTEISMTETFKQCVTSNPSKFSKELGPFLEVPPIYVLRLLWGLAEVWRNNQDFAWDKLLDFMWQLIEPDSFWAESYEKDKKSYRRSIIQAIADLIKEGTRSDDHAFNPDLLPKAKKILLRLSEKAESDLGDIINIVTSILNSTKGHIYEALVNYSLRYARLYKKADAYRWDEEVKSEFNQRLDRKIEPSLEFSVILGRYLPNLIYLDKQWVTENIERIFPKNNPTYWEASMCGYLYYANKVYEVIYKLLKNSGDSERALDTEFKEEFATKRLIQHIGISFITGEESLDDPSSLLVKVLEKSNHEQLRELTGFLWTFRGTTLMPDQKIKVKQLWGEIIDAIGDKLNQSEYRPLVTNLCRWLALVDEIDDEIFNWMKQLVRYLEKDYCDSFIIEYLLKHIEKTPQKVGDIYIEMLSHGVYPTYKEEVIKELVQKLYGTNADLADKICNMYGSKGYVEILEDVYKEHHKKAKS